MKRPRKSTGRAHKPKDSKRLLPHHPVESPPPATSGGACRLGTVTLWGEVLAEQDLHIQFAVKNHGDALDVGLSGKVWIAKRQIFGAVRQQDGYQYVRVTFAYASMLAQSCQQCE